MAQSIVDDNQAAFQPLIPQSYGPPEQTAQANLVPFVTPDDNVAAYNTVQQNQQALQPLAVQQPQQEQNNFIDDSALIDKVQKGASGTGWQPTALAVMAALSGNFAPAMMLEEQKRKTQLISQAVPVVAEINNRIRKGAPDKALELMEKAAATLGPRSPELAKYFDESLKRLNESEIERGTAGTMYKAYAARAADMKAQTGQDAPYSNWLPVWKDIIDKKPPGGAKALIAMMKQGTERQVMKGEGNTYNFLSPLGEPMVSQQAPIGVSEGDLRNPAGLAMAARNKMDITGMTNAMNNQPFIYDGQPMPANPAVANMLRRELAQVQGQQAQLEVGKNIGVSPDWNDAAIQEGIPPERIASKQLTREESSKVYDRAVQTAGFRNSAMLREIENVPIASANIGKDIIDINTGQSFPHMTQRQASLDPTKAVLSDKQVGEVRTGLKLERRLPLLTDTINKLPNSTDTLDRLSSYIDRTFNNYFGIDPNLTGQQALQAAVKSTIEEYANAQGVNASRYDYITRPITESGANKQGALAVVDSFKKLIAADKEALLKQGKPILSATQPQQSASERQTGVGAQQPSSFPTYTDMGIDPATAYAIHRNENSKAGQESPKGALHEWQVTLPTAERYNFTEAQWRNPDNSRKIAGTILQDLEHQFPSRPDLVMAAYFSGPGNIDKKTMTIIDPNRRAIVNGVPTGPTVQQYVDDGMIRYNQYKRQMQPSQQATAQPTQQQQAQNLPQQQPTQGTSTQSVSPTVTAKPGKPVGKIIW